MTTSQKRKEFVRSICPESTIRPTPEKTKSFLERNVKQAIKRHQFWAQQRQRLPNGRREPADSEPGATETITSWKPPSGTMLKRYFEADEETLMIDILRVSPLGSNLPRSAKRKRQSPSPERLIVSEEPLKLHCNVTVVILDKSSTTTDPVVLSQLDTSGTLTSRDHDGVLYFDVRLRKPCRFPLSELRSNQDTADVSRSKARPVSQYGLEIYLECRNPFDRAALLATIESKTVFDYCFACPSEMKLCCTTDDLKSYIARGSHLQLTRTARHEVIKLGSGMELSVDWSQSRPAKQLSEATPLSNYNAKCLQQYNSALRTVAPVTQTGKNMIRWASTKDGYTTRYREKDLRCVFCEDSLPHSSITYLLLHLKLHHDHFDFEHFPDINEIRISISKITTEEVREVSHDEQEELVLPDSPFDLLASSNDPRTWGKYNRTRHDQNEQLRPRSTDAIEQKYASASRGAAQPHTDTNTKVEDSQPRPRRKVKVPNVPGGQLFRRVSKRVVKGGDEISDEEEGVEQSFPLVDHHHAPTDLEKTEADRRFGRLWSGHLSLYPIKADVYARASVERFARKYKVELSTPEMKNEFSKRLDQFLSYGIIDAETVSTCLNMLTIPEPDIRPGAAADTDVSMASPMSAATPNRHKSPSKPPQQNGATPRAGRATGKETAKRSRPDSLVSPSPSDSASPSKRVKWAGGSSFAPVAETVQASPGAAAPPQQPTISVDPEDHIRISVPNGSQVEMLAMAVVKPSEHHSEGDVPERVELKDLDFARIMGRVRSRFRVPYDIQTGRISDYSLEWEHRNGTLTCWDEAGWQKVLLKAIELPNIEKSLDGFRLVGDRRQDRSSGQGEMAIILDKETWSIIPKVVPRGIRWEKTLSGCPRVWGPLSHSFWDSLYQPAEPSDSKVDGEPPPKTALKSPRESAPATAGASSKVNKRAITLNGNESSPRQKTPLAKSTATPLKKKDKESTNADEERSSTKPPRRGMCVCGKPAARSPSCIMCSNAKCRFKIFHLACVKLEQRYPGWTCDYCP